MTRWRWALLSFELFLFALILILPQVDLPDFTFHGGTAPVIAKAKFSPPPVMVTARTAPSVPSAPQVQETRQQPAGVSQPRTTSLLCLLCVLLC